MEYPQLYPPFINSVSILDLIFNTGKNAPLYLKSYANSRICGGGG
ncbi:MAG: WbqC family protein [Helicobacter sp.]|nr:WbqC family protein [Helicobacter sp.]